VIEFARSSGDSLSLDDDGAFQMRRTNGSRVGRFAGQLDDADLEAIRRDSDAAAGTEREDRTEPWRSGATGELLTVGGVVVAELDQHEEPAGPWGAVIAACRRLLDELVAHPSGALELELTADPLSGRLRHIGSSPVAVDLSAAGVEAYLAGADGSTLGSWSSAIPGTTEADRTIAPGWEADLGLAEAGFSLGEGRSCEVTVSLALPDPVPYPATLWESVS
jgi:hypothetical protein